MKKCDCYKTITSVYYNPITLHNTEYSYGVCNGTKEREHCNCEGNQLKCDFYPEMREAAKKENTKPTTIYYAHHQWKYKTKVEEYELGVIKRYFPNAVIFNPSTDLKCDSRSEENIMRECINTVSKSDIVVFSSMDGSIGKGVFREIINATATGKLVLYIYQNQLITNWQLRENPVVDNDRVYAFIDVKGVF